MADQDQKTGAVDPRAAEMNTGAQTGQAAPAAPKTDASGKDLAAVSGSAQDPSPGSGNSPATPSNGPSSTDTQSSDDAGSVKTDADIRQSVDALVDKHAEDNRDGRNAIIDASAGVRSVKNTTAMVDKAETQSTDMQTGAQVAHDNAFKSLVKRLEKLCATLGQDIAKKVGKELGKLHGMEDTVRKALKEAGVID